MSMKKRFLLKKVCTCSFIRHWPESKTPEGHHERTKSGGESNNGAKQLLIRVRTLFSHRAQGLFKDFSSTDTGFEVTLSRRTDYGKASHVKRRI